jgi:hypothetical protein
MPMTIVIYDTLLQWCTVVVIARLPSKSASLVWMPCFTVFLFWSIIFSLAIPFSIGNKVLRKGYLIFTKYTEMDAYVG